MSSQTQIEEKLDLSKFFDNLWVAIVWDDPVNLMNYVTYVFIKLFNFSKEKAHKLMMQVHTCLLYTSPSPRDRTRSRMPSSA